jgi:hypothetical protein
MSDEAELEARMREMELKEMERLNRAIKKEGKIEERKKVLQKDAGFSKSQTIDYEKAQTDSFIDDIDDPDIVEEEIFVEVFISSFFFFFLFFFSFSAECERCRAGIGDEGGAGRARGAGKIPGSEKIGGGEERG